MSKLTEKYFEKIIRKVAGGNIVFYRLPNTGVRLGTHDADAMAKFIDNERKKIKKSLIKKERELYKISPEHTHAGIKLMADEIRSEVMRKIPTEEMDDIQGF